MAGFRLVGLLPDEGSDVARTLVGSDGTARQALPVLGFEDVRAVGYALPRMLCHGLSACRA